MKYLLLISFVITTVSCGEDIYNQELDRNLNKVKRLEAVDELTANEKELMSSFCAALNDKVDFFISKFVGSGETFNMQSAKSSCKENATLSADRPVGVKEVSNKLYFDKNATFPIVVTPQSDELSDLCSKVNSSEPIQRYVVSNNEVKWFEVYDNKQPECRKDAKDDKTLCLKITTGIKEVSTENYIVRRVDFMKTTIANTNFRGTIYNRRAVDSRNCNVTEMQDTIQVITSETI